VTVPASKLSTDDAFEAALDRRVIHSVFQPIVSLDDELPVGYEALARGPQGSPFTSPAALFGEAERRGRVAELDWICLISAYATALKVPNFNVALFVNAEPDTVGTPCPAAFLPTYEEAARSLDLVIEITERLVTKPATLVKALAGIRQRQVRFALDDVGVDPSSMNMLALLRPDVIKLDRSITQADVTSSPVAFIINAVLSEAARTGAAVLAEGIEKSEHLNTARSLGATLGQGWYFGHPGPPPANIKKSSKPLPRVTPRAASADTPFGVLAKQANVIEIDEQKLTPMSRILEDKALHADDSIMLFVTFPRGRDFDDDARLRYSHMASNGVNVTAYGYGLPAQPAVGVRGVSLDSDDPLVREKVVVVLGNHFAGALVGKPRQPDRRDIEVDCHGVITYDRALIIEAVQTLIERIPPFTPGGARLFP
jgi:EAL domain-containing protein (putative c-di-GMP-specific phosphodiesterase class I)